MTYFNEYVPNTVQIVYLDLIKLYTVGNFISIKSEKMNDFRWVNYMSIVT